LLRYTIIGCFIVLLSIITISEIIAQNNPTQTLTFVDPFRKFSIDYSSDWEAISPGHSFEEGTLDLIIQKPDKKQGYIEINHEEIIPVEKEKSNEEGDSLISTFSFLTNNSLDHILSSLFKDYISELHLQNVTSIKEINYDRNLISEMNSSSILYSYEKDDDEVFYGLYIVAKRDYNIFVISYIASSNYFDKNFPEFEKIIHSLKYNL
jgi:hypothetical protein